MELEVKYLIPSKEVADAVWNDELIQEMADPTSIEKVVMKGVYFDTEDYDLSGHNITVRVRAEGERALATLKWGGSTHDGFAERMEVNVPVSGEEVFIAPPIDLFKESEEGLDLMELIHGKQLVSLLETRFLRKRLRLNYGESIMEFAVDTGEIVTDAGNTPILEMEIELFAGNAEDIKKLGAEIAEKYDLIPGQKSKFSRGLALLRGK